MAELDAQLKPNFSATAKKWLLERTTLAKRWKGQTMSREEANSEFRQLQTNVQEEAPIARTVACKTGFPSSVPENFANPGWANRP